MTASLVELAARRTRLLEKSAALRAAVARDAAAVEARLAWLKPVLGLAARANRYPWRTLVGVGSLLAGRRGTRLVGVLAPLVWAWWKRRRARRALAT